MLREPEKTSPASVPTRLVRVRLLPVPSKSPQDVAARRRPGSCLKKLVVAKESGAEPVRVLVQDSPDGQTWTDRAAWSPCRVKSSRSSSR